MPSGKYQHAADTDFEFLCRIEHLDPPVLAALPKTLFGDYRPKVVVISTPNGCSVLGGALLLLSHSPRYAALHAVEFNVHFDGLKLTPRGTYMRHDDHRFEWTRAQFEEWCLFLKRYSRPPVLGTR
ncbi:MAG: hypothetical protein BJ554DRAFT_2164 [Olpidium bornovanus]|uniref:Small RNA 2'-O-methyltransferase n=1 Tax=Olpidium bornovanus TaxID=278681 RepID=A0A8H8DGM6_9FUNG|nr:MAG: hypothetical protein BJ554DRAFT_2164 [Olpidium bornovanus]